MSILGTKHQGKKSYTVGGTIVALGISVMLGYSDTDHQLAGGGVALAGLAVMALRAGARKIEKLIEERTGWDIPDELVEKLATKAGEKAAETIAKSLGETPESPGTVIVREAT